MKHFNRSLSAVKSLAVICVLACMAGGAQAAAILQLSGTTPATKYETDAGIRISLIDWSTTEQQALVENAWRSYQQDQDLESFLKVVNTQDSRGYLFTAAATGYRIAYAWKEDTEAGQMMHFLVAPGLKTRNPYLWRTPNNDAPEFTLVQVLLDQDSGIARSSLDGNIVVDERGRLALDRFDDLEVFATVKDSTPYYLK